MLIAKKRRQYNVKTDIYEGPFDLLLNLISCKKINIYDISIESIAKEYNSYLERLSQFDLEIASDFLLLAATLMELKAESLFPETYLPGLYEPEIEFPETREELIRRLVEYKTFKNASAALMAFLESQSKYFARQSYFEESFSGMLSNLVLEHDLSELGEIAYELLGKTMSAQVSQAVHIIPIPVSVEERKMVIFNRVSRIKKMSFTEIVGKNKTPIETITDFLAILELYKEGKVTLSQIDPFGEIEVTVMKVN